MIYNCLIVDDEQLARQLIAAFIQKIPYLTVAGEARHPMEALEFMQNQSIDIIFLDIQMPEITGVEWLKSKNIRQAVILTTAYAEYALEGYQLNVMDYLVKPFAFERFYKAAEKTREFLELKYAGSSTRPAQDFISVHADHKIHKIRYEDILYIEGLREYVSFYTREQRIISLQSLKKLEELLPSDQFVRIHKSYIVPVVRIKNMEGNEVEIGNKKIPVGRSYREIVLKRIFNE